MSDKKELQPVVKTTYENLHPGWDLHACVDFILELTEWSLDRHQMNELYSCLGKIEAEQRETAEYKKRARSQQLSMSWDQGSSFH